MYRSIFRYLPRVSFARGHSSHTDSLSQLLKSGKECAEQGNRKKAEEIYWKAIEMDPKHEESYRRLFSVLTGGVIRPFGIYNEENFNRLRRMYNENVLPVKEDRNTPS